MTEGEHYLPSHKTWNFLEEDAADKQVRGTATQTGALIHARTHSSLYFLISSGTAVSCQHHIDPPVPRFPYLPTIAWLLLVLHFIILLALRTWDITGILLLVNVKQNELAEQGEPGQYDGQDHYKELTACLTTRNTIQQMDKTEYYTVLLQRHLKTLMNNIHRSPKRGLADLHIRYKTRIHVGFLTEQLSVFSKIMHISKWKRYSHIAFRKRLRTRSSNR